MTLSISQMVLVTIGSGTLVKWFFDILDWIERR